MTLLTKRYDADNYIVQARHCSIYPSNFAEATTLAHNGH